MSASTGRVREGLSFGPYSLSIRERLLTREGVPVELGGRALDILIALVSRPNEVVSKKELLSQVWPDVTVEESSLRFHMVGLRKALGDGKDGARYITTLAGRGYCFVATVSHLSDQGSAVSAVAGDFPHTNLPGRLVHMVGRDEDVLRISAHLIGARFVSIVGIGGVGKTTVAIAVGHHLSETFERAVMAVDLSMLSDPGLVATAIASMLGLSVQSEDATPDLIAYLRSKRMLLILDTCEHLIEAIAALTAQIYTKAPDVHILATSREVLQVEGEHVYRLDTLACPPEDAEDGSAAQTFPAPRLFIERATASGARLDLSDAEVAIVVRICRKLDGVALAIELAARRVEAYGLQQTETLLDQHLTLLLLGHRSATPRQRTLQAALDWSYRLLSELERVVLRRLAVFVGQFTLDAALAVVTGSDIDQSNALGAIESLVGKSMVATRPTGAMMRYRLLDTTRAYVLDIAIGDAEVAELAARHATYYQRWLEQSGSEWPMLSTGPGRSPHFAALNNTRSALEWCFGEHGDAQLGIKLAAAAAPVFLTMSLLPECYRWSERAIAMLDDTTRGGADEMQLQAGLGVASFNIHGPSEVARAALNRSLAIAEAHGNVLSQVAMLRTLSLFCHRHAEFNVGLEHAKRARAIAGATEEPDANALAQSALGMSLHWIGDHRGARSALEPALQHWSSTRRTYFGVDERVFAGMSLARTLWLQGFPAQALDRARQSLDDTRLSSNPASLAISLSWISGVLIWVGDLRSAKEHVDWLIPYAQSHSLSPFLHVGRAYRGTLAILGGDPNGGVETIQDCLKYMNFEILTTEFNIFLAQGLIAVGRAHEGMARIDETIRRVETNGKLYLLPEALRVKGHAVLASPGSPVDEAETCFTQSLEWARRQAARAWELRTAIDLARFWANRGNPEVGRRLLQPIFEQFTEGRDTADLQTAARLLAELGAGQ
ncbi:MAG TPA: winged helix-turn-helix domain-containing protein [Xanthobacteraceae bacterium]|nr:winged helix-turn-helix domain-containing protein [Xanthobacteraceae bacterium]